MMAVEPPPAGEQTTAWLTPAEYQAWRSFLAGTQTVFRALEEQLQADAGMPMAYYDVLVRLSEAPQHSLRMVSLAKVLGFSTSRLSHAMNRLEACGWVQRESHPSDRRGQVAVLTEAGHAALAAAAPGHVAAVRAHLVDLLTPEQLQQLGDITRILARTAPTG